DVDQGRVPALREVAWCERAVPRSALQGLRRGTCRGAQSARRLLARGVQGEARVAEGSGDPEDDRGVEQAAAMSVTARRSRARAARVVRRSAFAMVVGAAASLSLSAVAEAASCGGDKPCACGDKV